MVNQPTETPNGRILRRPHQVLHHLRLDLSDQIVVAIYYMSLLDLRDRLDVLQHFALKTSFSVYQDKRYC